jgi:hypothetical protein
MVHAGILRIPRHAQTNAGLGTAMQLIDHFVVFL